MYFSRDSQRIIALSKYAKALKELKLFNPDVSFDEFSDEMIEQQQNLIETLKQNCRRIVREKTGKKPYTSINIARI